MTKSQIVAEIKDLVSATQGNGPPTRSQGNEREANKSTREGSRSRSPRGQWWRNEEEKEDPWHNGMDPWARAATPGTGKKEKGEQEKRKEEKRKEEKGKKQKGLKETKATKKRRKRNRQKECGTENEPNKDGRLST